MHLICCYDPAVCPARAEGALAVGESALRLPGGGFAFACVRCTQFFFSAAHLDVLQHEIFTKCFLTRGMHVTGLHSDIILKPDSSWS